MPKKSINKKFSKKLMQYFKPFLKKYAWFHLKKPSARVYLKSQNKWVSADSMLYKYGNYVQRQLEIKNFKFCGFEDYIQGKI